MGIIVTKNNDKNTELNRRITADLRNKGQVESFGDNPDFVEDTDYTRDLKKTSKFGWVWAVLIVLALIAIVLIVVL